MTDLGLDLPLESTPASRFMIWISAALVFLAIMAFAIAAMADKSIKEFALQPKIMTVALTPAANKIDEAADTAAVLAYLKGVSGVAFADAVSEQELGMLVEPWLGDDSPTEDLPLPRLIDVGFNPGIEPDIEFIDGQLQSLSPGASIGYGGMERDNSEELARLLRVGSLVVGGIVVLLSLLVSFVTTRMNVDIHKETVDLLRLMGAADNYVARQFEQHAMFNALRGALIGFALAAVVLLFAIWSGQNWLDDVLSIELRPLDWVLLAMTPVLITVFTAFVARQCARWMLRSQRQSNQPAA